MGHDGLPGHFGAFGGLVDSVRFVSDPAGFVERHYRSHGPVFRSRIGARPCVFAAEYEPAREVLASHHRFPANLSLLQLVRGAVGEAFVLCPDQAEAEWWSAAVLDALCDTDGGTPRLRPEVAAAVDSVIAARVGQWVERGMASVYDMSKALAVECQEQAVLGCRLSEAERKEWQELLTLQFRGCESLPLEGMPVIARGLAAGTAARQRLVLLAEARIRECGQCPDAAGVLHALAAKAAAAGRSRTAAAEHGVFLLHAMVPKALAAVCTALFVDLTHSPDGSEVARELAASRGGDDELLNAVVTEALRLHPPLGVVLRGLSPDGAPVGAHTVRPAKGEEWLAFSGVHAANRDPAVYPDADAFRPRRWLQHPPPAEPLSFGAGPRRCPGEQLSRYVLVRILHAVFAAGCIPEVGCHKAPPVKQLPVTRPTAAVPCSFVEVPAVDGLRSSDLLTAETPTSELGRPESPDVQPVRLPEGTLVAVDLRPVGATAHRKQMAPRRRSRLRCALGGLAVLAAALLAVILLQHAGVIPRAA